MNIDIRGLIKNSFNEWEGRICAVVFTAHCNWRCPYCHGATLVNDPQSMPQFSVEQVLELVRSKDSWLDGIAITGGEPTLQPGLVEFIREVKKYKPVKLETNGTHPEVIKQLLDEKLLACLCMDYKAPLDGRLVELTGVPAEVAAVEKVKESYDLSRAAEGIEKEFHTTLCPEFIDRDTLIEMGKNLPDAGELWVLQQYENDVEMLDGKRAGRRRFTTEELDDLEAAANSVHGNVLMRRGRQ